MSECSICIERKDTYGSCRFCWTCGKSICEFCNAQHFLHNGRSCPLCRSPYNIDLTNLLENLKNLSDKGDDYAKIQLGNLFICSGNFQLMKDGSKMLEETVGHNFIGIKTSLAIYYVNTSQNYKKAYKYLLDSIYVPGAIMCLSNIYKHGLGRKSNPRYSRILFKIASRIDKNYDYMHIKTGKRHKIIDY
jgi:hypothetical protein